MLTCPRVRDDPHVVGADLQAADAVADVLVPGRHDDMAGVHLDEAVLGAEQRVQPLRHGLVQGLVRQAHVDVGDVGGRAAACSRVTHLVTGSGTGDSVTLRTGTG